MIQEKSESEITIRDYWDVILKRKKLFAIAFLSVLSVGLIIMLFKKSVYSSTAEVAIDTTPVKIETTGGATLIKEEYGVDKIIQLMKSDIVTYNISELLKNAELPEERFDTPPDRIEHMLKVSSPMGQFGKGDTSIINITATSKIPKEAYAVVKNAITAFIDQSNQYRKKLVNEMYNTFNKQLEEKHEALEDAERKLTQFVLDNDIIARGVEVGVKTGDGDEPTQQAARELTINDKYLALKSKRINEEDFLEEIKKHRQQNEITALSIIANRQNELVDLALRDSLYEKERELSKLLLTQSELHPNVIEMKGEVAEAKKKITMELDRVIDSLERSVSTLKREEEKLRKLIEEGLSDKMVEYSALKRDVDVKKDIYHNVVRQLEELNVYEKLLGTPFLNIIKAPSIPSSPANPKLSLFLIWLINALVMGIIAIFVAEALDISIKTVEDIEDILGLNLLAAIPMWKKEISEGTPAKHLERHDIGLVSVRHPQSVINEAFRTLRTNIDFVTADKNIKSILITSAGPKEGKSSISANLAVAMARSGEKILLIDSDLRRPSLHKIFNVDNLTGFSTILVSKEQDGSFDIKDTEVDNLKFIPAGPIPPNPNELLSTEKMEQFLIKVREQFDRIILDSPPALTVSDSLVLAKKTEGVIMVFLSNKTAKKAGLRAKLALKNVGANILGGVLNCVETTKGGYYYNYNYYTDEKKK